MSDLTPRPSIMRFAQAMEARLQENEHKGGWENSPDGYLMSKLSRGADELRIALFSRDGDYIIKEAADVANYAMMLAENRGELRLQ